MPLGVSKFDYAMGAFFASEVGANRAEIRDDLWVFWLSGELCKPVYKLSHHVNVLFALCSIVIHAVTEAYCGPRYHSTRLKRVNPWLSIIGCLIGTENIESITYHRIQTTGHPFNKDWLRGFGKMYAQSLYQFDMPFAANLEKSRQLFSDWEYKELKQE